MYNVEVESNYADSNNRADLGFVHNDIRYDIELKTPNGNWSIDGVMSKTRPISKNITSIIADYRKLEKCIGKGIVAFVLFPIPAGDNRWKEHLDKISNGIGKKLSEENHCSRVKISIDNDNYCEVIICCISI